MTLLPFTPIGTIHSPFADAAGMPIQPAGAREAIGTADLGDVVILGPWGRCYLVDSSSATI